MARMGLAEDSWGFLPRRLPLETAAFAAALSSSFSFALALSSSFSFASSASLAAAFALALAVVFDHRRSCVGSASAGTNCGI